MDDEGILIQHKVARLYLYHRESLHALLSHIPSSPRYLPKTTMSSIDTKIPRRMDRPQAFPQNVHRMFHPELNQQSDNQNAEKQKATAGPGMFDQTGVLFSHPGGQKNSKGRDNHNV